MNSEYILRANIGREHYALLTSLLEVIPSSTQSYWEYSIKESSNLYTNAINHFLDLIEKNIYKLRQSQIGREHLSVWYLYEYEEQCNMEFDPIQLKRLGDMGIFLCISCWEKK